MRVNLGGRAIPRSEFALIGLGGGVSSGVDVVLLLDDGDIFHPADYIALGFTNYEAECIGAAGGRGGNWIGNGPAPFCAGGAGGGGGLHRAIGLLEDLPDDVLAAVGQPGTDGRNSNNIPPYVGRLTPAGQFDWVLDADGFAVDLEILLNSGYISPLDGSDGGESSFGLVCHASGGKGGQAAQLKQNEPYPMWGPAFTGGYGGVFWSYYFIPGEGGDGGLGDRDPAGGADNKGLISHIPAVVTFGPEVDQVVASDGVTTWLVPRARTHTQIATTAYVAPTNGPWDGLHIGAGGGGGYGGKRGSKDGSSGARGSMNFVDTSVYGPGQLASRDSSGALTIPGGGGGAKLNKLARYGSFATGYNPAGAVLIRLTKVD